jgi:hypothetical protein
MLQVQAEKLELMVNHKLMILKTIHHTSAI